MLAREVEKGIESIKAKNYAYRKAPREKVLFIVWPEPLIAAGPGTVIDDAVSLLGYQNIAAAASTSYPKYSLEEVIHQAPEAIIIGSATGMDMRAVSRGLLKKLSTVPAVKNGAVCYTGDALYRLGPRVIKGIEELAECLK
jgi:iron complex transport system substrate-binding protein